MIHSVTQVLLEEGELISHNCTIRGEFQTMVVRENHKHSDSLNGNEHALHGTCGVERTSLMWPCSKRAPNVPFQGTPSILKCSRVLTLNFCKWLDCHRFLHFSRDASLRQLCPCVHGAWRRVHWRWFPQNALVFAWLFYISVGTPGGQPLAGVGKRTCFETRPRTAEPLCVLVTSSRWWRIFLAAITEMGEHHPLYRLI